MYAYGNDVNHITKFIQTQNLLIVQVSCKVAPNKS